MTHVWHGRVRALAVAALALAYLQIVFGAIVRITGSGFGCGDDWPRCLGQFFPPLDDPALVIEWTHRLLALVLSIAAAALVAVAFAARRYGGAQAPDVRRPAVLALALIVITALLGWATVAHYMAAPPVVVHLTLAMAVLATFAWAALRAGALGGAALSERVVTPRTRRAATAAAGLTFVIIVLGSLTAHVPGAAGSCAGFPHCRVIYASGAPLWIHLAHRVLAFALLFHMIGVVAGVRRRAEPSPVRRAALLALIAVVAQLLLAAAMVEMRFPALLRALHQAVGTAIWLATFTLAGLTWLRRDAADERVLAIPRPAQPDAERA